LFLLTFHSSAFVPRATMPGRLQAIGHASPITYAVDALSALLADGLTARPVRSRPSAGNLSGGARGHAAAAA
jgi:hypothetical protein